MFSDTLGLIATCAICIPAVILASSRSTWIVDYLFMVVALNRGLRRIIDWLSGEFNPYSLISVTPLFVGGLAALVAITELNARKKQTGYYTNRVFQRYMLACGLAFIVGLVHVKAGAIFAMGDYTAPIGLLCFGALHCRDERIINRWCNSVAITTAIVAGYGLYQFYTIPPWDAFWVEATGGVGYFGTLEPTKMTLFSTMAERGPAATFLGSGLILIMLRPGTLGWFRWPVAGLVLFALVLTYSRTSIIQLGLALCFYPILNRGRGKIQILLIVLLVLAFGGKLLKTLPTEQAATRIGTIGNLAEDHSMKGRLRMMSEGLSSAAKEPLGLGIGSFGMSRRIVSGVKIHSGDATGYVELLRTFGWIGFPLIVMVVLTPWLCSSKLVKTGKPDRNVALFRAWFLAGMVALFSGNWLFMASFFWVLAGYVLGKADEQNLLRVRALWTRERKQIRLPVTQSVYNA